MESRDLVRARPYLPGAKCRPMPERIAHVNHTPVDQRPRAIAERSQREVYEPVKGYRPLFRIDLAKKTLDWRYYCCAAKVDMVAVEAFARPRRSLPATKFEEVSKTDSTMNNSGRHQSRGRNASSQMHQEVAQPIRRSAAVLKAAMAPVCVRNAMYKKVNGKSIPASRTAIIIECPWIAPVASRRSTVSKRYGRQTGQKHQYRK